MSWALGVACLPALPQRTPASLGWAAHAHPTWSPLEKALVGGDMGTHSTRMGVPALVVNKVLLALCHAYSRLCTA